MYVLVTGSLCSGVREVFGPFDCSEDAVRYADRFLSGIEWLLLEMQDVRGDMQ